MIKMINAGGYSLTSEEIEDLQDLASEDQDDSEIDWSDPAYDPTYR